MKYAQGNQNASKRNFKNITKELNFKATKWCNMYYIKKTISYYFKKYFQPLFSVMTGLLSVFFISCTDAFSSYYETAIKILF